MGLLLTDLFMQWLSLKGCHQHVLVEYWMVQYCCKMPGLSCENDVIKSKNTRDKGNRG